jgi:hypothetical protein
MVIGVAPVHGHGLLISDTRAEFSLMPNAPSANCIQKIHYVGPNIIAGFAGSIKLGYRQIAVLKRELGSAKPEYGWNIDQISESWLRRSFQRMFDQSEDSEKFLGSHFILVAAHPHKTHGGSDDPWMDVVRFCSPSFEPEKGSVQQPMFIGSEAVIEKFRLPFKEVMRQQFSIHMLVKDQQEQTAAIMGILHNTRQVENFHVGLVTRGNATITDSNPDLKFADSYGTFIKYCAEYHLEPACAFA